MELVRRRKIEKAYPDRDVEFSNKNQDDEKEASPGPPDAQWTSPRNFVEAATLNLPPTAETDVSKTNTSPAEETCKTGDGE